MRVLALTRNASLLVALGSMMREWEVISVPDVASATQETQASVALIDLGDTPEGVAAANELFRLGVSIPCVVLGDAPSNETDVTVLIRPFSLEELTSAVRDASASPRLGVRSRATVEEPAPVEPPVDDLPTTTTEEPAAELPSRPAKSRPFTVVPPPPPSASGAEVEELEEPAALAPEPAPVTERPGSPAPAARPVYTPPAPPPSPRVEPRPQGAAMAASAAQPAPSFEEPVPESAGRWRLRRKGPRSSDAETAEDPVVRRLKAAATSAAELETLVEELPFVSNLNSIADGLVSEIETQLRAQVASAYVLRDDGYHVVAFRGLSRVEAGMIVAPTQPLFSDVTQTGEGILIQPIDLAQGLVAGIGGARTEAMMAVPAIVHGKQVAVVIAGSDRFSQQDLERLNDMAIEAAPGLAVALALARLRDKL